MRVDVQATNEQSRIGQHLKIIRLDSFNASALCAMLGQWRAISVKV